MYNKYLIPLIALLLISGTFLFSSLDTVPTLTIQPHNQLAQVSSSLTDGLVGWWKFDEGSGTIATDSSGGGNNHSAILNNASWVSGRTGTALLLDGSNASAYVSSFPSDLSIGTISFWTYNNTLTIGDGFLTSTSLNPFCFVQNGLRCMPRNNAGGVAFDISAPIPLGQWIFFVLTWDMTSAKIYSNGSLISTRSVNGIVQGNIQGIYIGNERGNGGRAIDGYIDDVRIYNRVLSEKENLDLYNYGLIGIPADPNINTPVVTTIPTDSNNITAPLTSKVTVTEPSTYYIDYENGNDLNNGKSKNEPWKKAPGMVGFQGLYSYFIGDAFTFKGGVTWPANVFPYKTQSGTIITSDKSWYKNINWSEPVFDGGGSFAENVAMLSIGGSDVKVNNIRISNLGHGIGQARAITITAASNIEIKNVYMDPNAQHGILLVASGPMSNIEISHNKFTRVTNSLEVGAVSLISNLSIHDNEFFDNGPNFIEIDHGDGVHLFGIGGVNNFKFYNNRYYGDWTSGFGAATAQLYLESTVTDGLIYNNVFGFNNVTQPNRAGWMFSPGMLVIGGCNRCKIFNNIIHSGGVLTGESGAKTGLYVVGGNVEFKNNIILGTGYGILKDTTSQLVSDYNIFSLRPGYAVVGGVKTDFRNLSGWQKIGYDLYSTVITPKFINNNYLVEPSSDSIAVDRGENLSAYFTTDINGHPRPTTGPWTIGAYEYPSGGNTPAPINASCSTTLNQCTSGTFNDITDTSTQYLWSCIGSNGGTTASCSLPKTSSPILGDFNNDNYINSLDISILFSNWNTQSTTCDLNKDGIVNSLDYVIVVKNWTV